MEQEGMREDEETIVAEQRRIAGEEGGGVGGSGFGEGC